MKGCRNAACNIRSKAQIIYDDTGAPTSVVIPYARFRDLAPEAAALSDEALFDLAMREDRAAVATALGVLPDDLGAD